MGQIFPPNALFFCFCFHMQMSTCTAFNGMSVFHVESSYSMLNICKYYTVHIHVCIIYPLLRPITHVENVISVCVIAWPGYIHVHVFPCMCVIGLDTKLYVQ